MTSAPQHPLRGCWLKLKRAEEHREALEKEIDAFFRHEPPRVVAHKPKGGELHAALRGVDEVPPHWVAIAGDSLQCLRSGLEHIAYACARRSHVEPPRAVSFPILKTAEAWAAYASTGNGRANREAVGPDAWDLFEKAQPHVRGIGDPPEVDALWVLNELAKIDRHRTLHLAAVATTGLSSYFGPLSQDGNVTTWLDGRTGLATPPLTPEPESSPWSFTGDWKAIGPDGHEQEEMRSYNYLPFCVGFDPDGEVAQGFDLLESLMNIEQEIRVNVLLPFQSLFGPGHAWAT